MPRFREEALAKNMELVERVRQLAAAKGCTPGQLALAWVLARGGDVVPIPGTKKVDRLEENLAAVGVKLSEDDVRALEAAVPEGAVAGGLAGAPRRVAAAALAAVVAFRRDLTFSEVSGSLGDLGTFLPLLVGLVKNNGLSLSTTLIFSGMYNVITGFAFGVPMPVQPMKTIAAVALSQAPLTIPQIMAAGIFVSACVMAMGALRAFWLASRLIPMPVIRGMQLGLGLELARKGWQQAWFADGKAAPARQWWGPEGLFLALCALAFILLTVYPREGGDEQAAPQLLPQQAARCGGTTGNGAGAAEEAAPGSGPADGAEAGKEPAATADDGASNGASSASGGSDGGVRRPLLRLKHSLERLGSRAEAGLTGEEKPDGGGATAGGGGGGCGAAAARHGVRLPAALVLVVLGMILTLAYYPEVVSALSFGPSSIVALVPSAEDWCIGLLRAGLPQLALTSFNSVISVTQLARELFPEKRTSPDGVAFSVGAMNLVGCWFGAMPCCHGAGGLAAQARFGARSGAAPIFLGLIKLALGLLFGSSLFALLRRFPAPLLGAMLVYAGIELAACARRQRGERGVAVLLLTATVTLAMSNVAVGVAAGLIAAYLLLAWDSLVQLAAPCCRRAFAACRRRRGAHGAGASSPAAQPPALPANAA
ncbi:molybdate transporter 2 isoform A [Micractinium conductrix]|uniref:Molybdate transporter 2 isoform A n=1 Tax=Micractinium conductrix TaxID=554055 RepID=A0A2P6VCE8_9CHLO|nr:molybdate transporter 2 isoform A [Micractinium conductrix]|eukprot:PSC71766.1 molybdate transporter 2 isoform A [Micractinium conductrix]